MTRKASVQGKMFRATRVIILANPSFTPVPVGMGRQALHCLKYEGLGYQNTDPSYAPVFNAGGSFPA